MTKSVCLMGALLLTTWSRHTRSSSAWETSHLLYGRKAVHNNRLLRASCLLLRIAFKSSCVVQPAPASQQPPADGKASGERDLTRKGSSVGPPARPVERAEPAGGLRPGASGLSAGAGRGAVKAPDAKTSRLAPAGSQQGGRGQLPSPPRPPPRPQLSAGGSSAGGAGTAVSPPAGFRSLLTGSAGGGQRLSLAGSGTSTLGSRGRKGLLRPARLLLNADTAAGFRTAFVVTPIGHSVALPFEQLKPGASAVLSCTSPATCDAGIRHTARCSVKPELRHFQHPFVLASRELKPT